MNSKAKIYNLFYKIIFPVVLLIYPLYGFNMGADVSDTTYSLANYMFFSDITGSWKYATFLSNLTGAGLLKLAGGKMIVMNILTGLIVSAIALIAYYFLAKRFNAVAVFISEIIAICLAWCPTVILYNYLTYLLLTVAVVLLYKAIISDSVKLYIIAGAVLGINVFVRISNVTEIALILALWYGVTLLYNKDDEKRKYLKPTLLCVAGFLAGLLISVILILLTGGAGGIGETVKWAMDLFSSKDSAGGYSMSEMILVIAKNYAGNMKYFILSMTVVLLGVAAYRVFKNKYIVVKTIGYTLCIIVLFVYYFRNGVFTNNYHNNGAIFGISVLAIIWQYVVFIVSIIVKRTDKEDKVLSMLMIIVLLITPLGSNNHLFTIINNMFLVLPATLGVTVKLLSAYKVEFEEKFGKGSVLSPSMFGMVLILVLLIQSVMFKFQYVFCDGTEGEALNSVVAGSDTMEGMKTSENHADAINGVCLTLKDEEGRKAIYYGNIPGMAYALKMPSAISTFWPDLDSYSADAFREEMAAIKEDYPLIVIDTDAYNKLWSHSGDNIKDEYIFAFIFEADYNVIYTNTEFTVLDK